MSVAQDEDKTLRRFFIVLVIAWTAVNVPVVIARTTNALGGLALPLLMWTPGIAAIVASLTVTRSLRPCGLGIGRKALPWLGVAFVLPIAYTLLVYLPLRAMGVVELGSKNINPPYLLIALALSAVFAAGEEIGWRGFLAPRLVERHGFVRGSVFIGVAWTVFHVPALLFTSYGEGPSRLVGILLFGATVTALSLFLSWMRLAAGSVWPAVVYHGTHNVVFLHLFDPMTKRTPLAHWLTGESGVLLLLVMGLLALVAVVRSRG